MGFLILRSGSLYHVHGDNTTRRKCTHRCHPSRDVGDPIVVCDVYPYPMQAGVLRGSRCPSRSTVALPVPVSRSIALVLQFICILQYSTNTCSLSSIVFLEAQYLSLIKYNHGCDI